MLHFNYTIRSRAERPLRLIVYHALRLLSFPYYYCPQVNRFNITAALQPHLCSPVPRESRQMCHVPRLPLCREAGWIPIGLPVWLSLSNVFGYRPANYRGIAVCHSTDRPAHPARNWGTVVTLFLIVAGSYARQVSPA